MLLFYQKKQKNIKNFDHYSKKLDFRTTLNILLYSVYEELPSYREIERAFMNKYLCQEIGLDSLCHSSLSRKTQELDPEVLKEIFTHLVQKISSLKPSSKTTNLQLIDSTTIPLNKTWFPWAKFRQTKAEIKLHLNLCFSG